jgi:F0F1-type ATP synthase assembly protein I
MSSKDVRERAIWSLLGVGTTLVCSVALGAFGGAWLDRRLGTTPWLLVAGLVFGTAAGFLDLYRTVTRTLK